MEYPVKRGDAEWLKGAPAQAADGEPEWARALLDAGADPNDMPLIMAIQCGEAGIVQMMIEAGADVNQPFATTTPLIRAITACYPAIVRALIAAGAGVNQPDEQGLTPLQAAASKARSNATIEERRAIVEMLEAAGAKP